MRVVTINATTPTVDVAAWVAADVTLVGDVSVGPGASVFYTSVLRADTDAITVGSGTNIQDGCLIHADPGFPVRVGSGVSVGHRAILHGCEVEDDVLIGMGAIVLNGSRIGKGSLVAAGAVVLEGSVINAHSLVAGVPAKVRRETTEDERMRIRENAVTYLELSRINALGEARVLDETSTDGMSS
ncbi:MAG: gamma carbonic anhydrase family protein [Actinomycetota bacterium]|nr:gamma carbonic anhydrase family protein [Actinomycetota bacterium]